MSNQDPEQRASDGGQDPRELMPSTQSVLNCTTQSLKLRNRQSNWNTNRLIPRDGLVPLQRVFQRLKILSVDMHLPCLFLFDPCLCLCVKKITAGLLFRWASAKCIFPKAFIALRKAFLASFSLGPSSTIFFRPQFWFLCLLFT